MKPLAILAAAFVLTATAHGRDHEFDAIVKRIETRCDTQPMRIPFLGVANFFVKIARPAGTSDMRLAIFEDLRRPLAGGDDFGQMIGEMLGRDWHPLLTVQERDEMTVIYAGGSGQRWKLLIATMERREVAVIRLRLNPEAMRRWIMNPYQEEKNRHRRD